jgi:hypothetical protein
VGTPEFDAIRPRTGAGTNGTREILANEMKSRAIVRSVARRQALRNCAVKRWAPLDLSVVVRTRAAVEKPETIIQGRETAERISHARAEPAVHSSADTTENGTGHPCVPQQVVKTMSTPKGKQVKSTAASNVEDVLTTYKISDVARPAWLSR